MQNIDKIESLDSDLEERQGATEEMAETQIKTLTTDTLSWLKQSSEMDLSILSSLEECLLMHCTQAIPLKELKKWTKSIVKKQYVESQILKEEQ